MRRLTKPTYIPPSKGVEGITKYARFMKEFESLSEEDQKKAAEELMERFAKKYPVDVSGGRP